MEQHDKDMSDAAHFPDDKASKCHNTSDDECSHARPNAALLPFQHLLEGAFWPHLQLDHPSDEGTCCVLATGLPALLVDLLGGRGFRSLNDLLAGTESARIYYWNALLSPENDLSAQVPHTSTKDAALEELYKLRFKLCTICEFVKHKNMPNLGDFMEECRTENDSFVADVDYCDYCKDDNLVDAMQYRMYRDESPPYAGEDCDGFETELEAHLSSFYGALWPSSLDMPGEHLSSRQLINFFHRQGISTSHGILNFRGNDFSEAKDEYHIFQRFQLVQELDWICKLLSNVGESAWNDIWELCHGDGEEVRNEMLGCIDVGCLEVRQGNGPCSIDSATNFTGSQTWTTQKVAEKLQNLFGKDGNNALSEIRQLLGLLEDDAKIDQFTISMDDHHKSDLTVGWASIFKKILSRTEVVDEIVPKRWTVSGFIFFLEDCLAKQANVPHLVDLGLSMPVFLIHSSRKAQNSVVHFLANKPATLRRLRLIARWDQPPMPPAFVEAAYSTCLTAIVQGVTSDTFTGLDSLCLLYFDIEDLEYPDMKSNPLALLLSKDSIHSFNAAELDEERERHRFKYPLSSYYRVGCSEVPIGTLNLFDCKMTQGTWKQVMEAAGRLSNLVNVSVHPTDQFQAQASVHFTLAKVLEMPNLKCFRLGGQWNFPAIDITSHLTRLLQKKSIVSLEICGNGYNREDDDSERIAYQMEFASVVEHLKDNHTLKQLLIDDMGVLDLTTAGESTSCLLENLKRTNNTSLHYIWITSSNLAGSRLLAGRSRNNDERHSDASKIGLLSKLNRFGRRKFQAEASRKARLELSRLLAKVDSRVHGYDAENQKLSIMFGLLLEKPSLWCDSMEGDRCGGPAAPQTKRQRLT